MQRMARAHKCLDPQSLKSRPYHLVDIQEQKIKAVVVVIAVTLFHMAYMAIDLCNCVDKHSDKGIIIKYIPCDVIYWKMYSVVNDGYPYIKGYSIPLLTFVLCEILVSDKVVMGPPIFNHFNAAPSGNPTTTGQLKLKCKICFKLVSGSFATSSNFHTHMRVRAFKT